MFKLLKAETVALTPELAHEFRDMTPWPGERFLDKNRVEHLREKHERGVLTPFQWVYAMLDGQKYRINAQHSSTMLCQLDGAFPEGLWAQLAVFDCEVIEDIALLFRQYDDRKSVRSLLDISGVYQGLYEPVRGVNRKTGKLCIEGIVWHDRYVVGVQVPSGDDIYVLFKESQYHEFIQFMGQLINSKTPELSKNAVAAAIYGTYLANAAEAVNFWADVARGGDPDNATSPATALDIWLRAVHEKVEKRWLDLKPANYYQGCIVAWNAFRHDRDIKEPRFDARKGFADIER